VFSPTAWGRDGAPEGIAYAKKIGCDVVAEIEYPYTATDATNECMTLRKAKAQYVIYHGYSGAASYTAIFFKTAKKVIPKVQLMGTHYTTISNFMGLICGDAYDGYIGVSCVPIMDSIPRSATPMDNPVVKMGHEFAKKFRPKEYELGLKGGIKEMGLYIGSMLYALLIQKALTDADNAGDLSREGVKKALDTMSWDFMGMFGGKAFSYKSHTIPMMRVYTTKIKMVQMGDKTIPTTTHLPLSEWINTDEMKW
jgi:branched-chain amino acid transport system substrate-binding protein